MKVIGWVIAALVIVVVFPAIGFRELGVLFGGICIFLAIRSWQKRYD